MMAPYQPDEVLAPTRELIMMALCQPDVELALSLEDAQGSTVSEPVSVTWRAKPFWTTRKILTYVVVGTVLTVAVIGSLIYYFSRSGVPGAANNDLPRPEELLKSKSICENSPANLLHHSDQKASSKENSTAKDAKNRKRKRQSITPTRDSYDSLAEDAKNRKRPRQSITPTRDSYDSLSEPQNNQAQEEFWRNPTKAIPPHQQQNIAEDATTSNSPPTSITPAKIMQLRKQIWLDVNRKLQISIDGVCITRDSYDSLSEPEKNQAEEEFWEKLTKAIPAHQQPDIFEYLQQGLCACALEYLRDNPNANCSISKSYKSSISDKNSEGVPVVLWRHGNSFSIGVSTKNDTISLQFGKNISIEGTIGNSHGGAIIVPITLTFTIPSQKLIEQHKKLPKDTMHLPQGTVYTLEVNDPKQKALLEEVIESGEEEVIESGEEEVIESGKEEVIESGEGIKLLENIYSHSDEQNCYPATLNNISSLMYFLFLKAKSKKQDFVEGTYVLSDDEGKLYKALEKLGKTRLSSHSIGSKEKQSGHYGIDFARGAIYPANMEHILFFSFVALDGKQKLFLKPEKKGLSTLLDTVEHGWQYATQTLPRQWGVTSEGNAENRKERLETLNELTQYRLATFNKVVSQHENEEHRAQVAENIKLFGLSYIYEYCTTSLKQQTSGGSGSTQQVENSLKQARTTFSAIKKYLEDNFDHLECRRANEVIFDLQELGIDSQRNKR